VGHKVIVVVLILRFVGAEPNHKLVLSKRVDDGHHRVVSGYSLTRGTTLRVAEPYPGVGARYPHPGEPPVLNGGWKTQDEAFAESGNVQGNSVNFFSMPDHAGTHIDAPRHFGKTGTPIDALYNYPCNVELPTVDIDADGKIRDLSKVTSDLYPDTITAMGQQALRSVNRETLPLVEGDVIHEALV